jgi:hypothetical protein
MNEDGRLKAAPWPISFLLAARQRGYQSSLRGWPVVVACGGGRPWWSGRGDLRVGAELPVRAHTGGSQKWLTGESGAEARRSARAAGELAATGACDCWLMAPE